MRIIIRTFVLLSCVFSVAVIVRAQAPAPSPTPAPKECTVAVISKPDVKVKIRAKPEPKFSKRDRQEHRGEFLTLRAIFCGTGQVTDIVVTSGLTDEMNARSIEAARLIEFVPAAKDGAKASQLLELRYFVKD